MSFRTSSDGSSRPLLSHAFKAEGSWLPFGRLLLFPGHLEHRVMGRVQEKILLADVRDVHWRTTDNEAVNFTLFLSGGRKLAGHLHGAGLWKNQLEEMLSRPRRAARPASEPDGKAPTRSAA